MTVSEYIMQFLKSKGVDTAFLVTGGQAMYLNDALCKTPEITPICVHHEQTAGMAADAYSRMTGKLGFALVTAGPGAANVLNGLIGGYMDSAPMLVVSGQSNLNCVEYMQQTGIRQYGIQGINTKDYAEKGTKYFVTVDDPSKIQFYMEKAYHLALTGRPGPVWVEVPLNIQNMQVPEKMLYGYTVEDTVMPNELRLAHCEKIIEKLKGAKCPLVVAGQGVRLSGTENYFLQLIEMQNIPVITTRLGIDLMPSAHNLYIGRPGNYGERSANFAVQNADFILVLGSRLSTASVGHNPAAFGKKATCIAAVDIDEKELAKPGVRLDIKIQDDLKMFLPALLSQISSIKKPNYSKWVSQCIFWKEKYPVMQPEYKTETPVNSYYLIDKLSELTNSETAVLVDTGSCFHVAAQGWKVKQGQRFLTTGGLSSMGYWVGVLGALVANKYKNTIVITGDGSLQMNIQELATIKHLNKPVKIVIFNNNGYLLIRQTQKNFMQGRMFGEGPKTGVYCPDALEIAKAYGIKALRISKPEELEPKLKEMLDYDGPVICDVITPEWQLIVPRVSSDKREDGTLVSRDYEDMFPYLSEEELMENMR